MIKLSIIIPTYNAEKFLDKGLPSLILEDENKRKQMEVLVVNDGTPDNSVAVAQTYVDEYPDLFRIVNKENGGHGSAINTGVEHATGQYMKVMDADDWFDTETLSHVIDLLDELEQSEAVDAVLLSYKTYNLELEALQLDPYESKDIRIENISKSATEFTKGSIHAPIVSLKEIMENWDDMYWGLTFHGMLYNRQFYKSLNHKLIEGVFYEDQEYATIPLAHASRIALFPEELYEYRIGDVNQSISMKSCLNRLSHYEAVIMRLLDAEAESDTFPEGGKEYWATKTEKFTDDYFQLCLIRNPDKKMLRGRMKDFERQIAEKSPFVYNRIRKNLKAFYWLNKLHMSEETYENKFIPMLHKVRGQKVE